MGIKLINIGFGNIVSANRLVATRLKLSGRICLNYLRMKQRKRILLFITQ